MTLSKLRKPSPLTLSSLPPTVSPLKTLSSTLVTSSSTSSMAVIIAFFSDHVGALLATMSLKVGKLATAIRLEGLRQANHAGENMSLSLPAATLNSSWLLYAREHH